MIIKDEKTRRLMTLLSWLLLATSLALIEWSNSKIIATIIFILITAMALFSFFSIKKAEEKNNERDQKANDSIANTRENQTRKIIYLLSWFVLATVTAVIIWRYSKIIAALVFILITAMALFSFFSIKKAEMKNNKD
ncbi:MULTISPECIES: hypothetical protein [Streptococcus]|uniref:DUF2178 domain-containing protein n=1 Tax=Streptococcus ratti FA-1 = DSM 20564 TaxID=699248 RepID=A0ABP2R087_STRRT|nr:MULTISPECIES: hypothetical protein [Streptococcus]EJN94572.1 hypothetical protein SRA_08541 [Streptococcus ratti FA-1 = DSM 20564]QEY06501.1 hypothetical protein FY406_01805 [Streptococcus ratti]